MASLEMSKCALTVIKCTVTVIRTVIRHRNTHRNTKLQRIIPLFGNSFKPIFYGQFVQHSRGVELVGRFTVIRFAKIFMTVWLGFAVIWTLLASCVAVTTLLKNRSEAASDYGVLLFPPIGIGFCLVGFLFIRLCWWISRNDIKYISEVIARALGDGSVKSN